MLAVVDRLCADRAVVLVAEDLQWADEWSLGLWTRLARSVDQIPLLVVGTSRPVAEHKGLARARLVVQEGRGAVVDLRSLSDGEVAAMAAGLAGGVPGPGLVGALGRAGGNPLYVRELVGALVGDGLVRVQAGAAELVAAAGALPGSLVASIGRRLSVLSPGTYRALHVAALLGAEFSAGEWATVTGLSAGQLAEIVDEASTAGVLVSGPGRLMFRHELIRQVLVERTPGTVRVELHRQMARQLAAAGYGVDMVAAQLVAAPGLDEWARAWLADSSQALVVSAPQVSADLLDRAVGLLGEDDPLWEALAARLAETLYRLGRDEAAGRMAEVVVAATRDGEVAGRMWVQSIRAAGRTGQFEQALARGQAAVVDPRLPAHWRARSLAWLANALLHLGRREQAQAQAVAALDEATRCGDLLAGGYARFVLYLTDQATQAFRLDEALASIGDDPESQDLRILLLAKQLDDLASRGKWDDYDTVLASALVAADQVGGVRAGAIQAMPVFVYYVRGHWDEALRQLAPIPPEYLDTSVPSGTGVGPLPRVFAATIGVRREDSDLVAEHMGGANALTDDIRAASVYDVMAWSGMLAWRAEAAADLDQALAWYRLLLDLPAQLQHEGRPSLRPTCAVALQVGDTAAEIAAAAARRRPPRHGE
jgi:tetratricopeptide (TPR) repeat protein